MVSEHKYTTLASWAIAVSRALVAQGTNPTSILNKVGLDLEAIEKSPDDRIPVEKMTLFWQAVAEDTGNLAFGLKVGEHFHSMNFRALGLLLVTCETLAQALEKIIAYQAMISDSVITRLQHTPESTALTIEPLEGVVISPLAIDAFFSTLTRHCKDIIGDKKLVMSIELMREEPENPKPWQMFFDCPVTFNAPNNSMWMNRAILELPTVMGDVVLADHNEQVVQQYLEKINALSWSQRTKQVIHKLLCSQEPTLADVAEVFNLTERTLGRRLKAEGNSYRQLLQDKRQELAKYYLEKTTLSITEISFNLAFTDVSNFSRAFHRWCAITPSEHRNKLR